jgi:hypothetical protein
MTESPLVAKWRQQLAGQVSGLHLTSAHHPLPMFTGCAEAGEARLVVRTKTKPPKPALANMVIVDRFEDQSGTWNLSLTLQDKKFLEVFLRLTDDLHGRTAAAFSEASALRLLGDVIDEWRRLLTPRQAGLLSMEELRGLVGELVLLLGRFSEDRSTEEAIEGWLGPLGLPQDFWYASTGFHESKAIGPSVTSVKISSAHQLDEADLELIVLRVSNASEQDAGATTLVDLVTRVVDALPGGASRAPLDDRLARLGVVIDDAYYRETHFLITQVTSYAVTPEFPAIRASNLPLGLRAVTYQIELAAISDHLRGNVDVS